MSKERQMSMKTSIMQKLNNFQEHLNNNEVIALGIVRRISKYLDMYGEASIFNKMSLIEIEKKEFIEKILKDYEEQEVMVTPLEEKFLHYIIEEVNIDLDEEEQEIFIKSVMDKIIKPLHNSYTSQILDQEAVFSLNFWQKQAKNKNFLEYLSVLYFDNEQLPFYICSYHRFNYLESLSLAKEKIAELVPVYEQIMDQIFTYSEESSYGHYLPYPLDIKFGRKDFLADYIMKTPKEKFHPKAKEYFLEKNPYHNFTLAILSSDKFTEEEKLSVIHKLNHYKDIPKKQRGYYERTYDEILNQSYFVSIFMMIEHVKDDVVAIDTKKLYELEEVEQRELLSDIIDEDKLHGRYQPYYYDYYSWPIYIKDGKTKEEIKEFYVESFIALTRFLKQEEKIHSFSLTKTGTIYKDEEHFQKKRYVEHEYQEEIIKTSDDVLQKKKTFFNNFLP